ncbi:MAG: PstS family phosphate ABC transporter substrate-binding protein [Chthoniobacterales bacterium]|nr:PstS family phosphate ABC transporter substrate-binding protein [Chthoniobacterales bacterium]
MKLLALLLASALAATPLSAQPQPAGALRIVGSNTFGETLGPKLIAAFSKTSPGIAVTLKRPGSAEGLAALIAGQADIATTSRTATPSELAAAKSAGVRLQPQTIGSYGVCVIVNESNPVLSLKPSKVRDIFTGKITNWKQAGGPDLPIRTFILDAATGARAGFQILAMGGKPYAESARALRDYNAIASAVAGDPSAIGYAGFGSQPSGVRALLINGEPPNSAAVYEQVYPYASPLYLYTLERRETPAAKKFIRFVLSKEGQRVLQDAGYVPRLPRPPSVRPSLAP